MDLSLVIPTYNREALLRQSVPKIANQEAGAFEYEAIFVINGSTDGSEAVLKDAAARWPDRIRYIYKEGSGSPAAPRNVGIRAARGNVILMIDDDVIPGPKLVFHHAEFHRRHPEPEFAAVGELTIPERTLDDPASFFHEFINYDTMRGREVLNFLDFWTCNVSVKRQFMLNYGMFDESLHYFEDCVCGYRLASAGMQLRFVEEARGEHLHQMKLANLGAKGKLIGRYLYQFEQLVPQPDVRRRYGILSPDIGARAYTVRLLNRVFLYSLSNPMFMAVLKGWVASNPKRSKISDTYYYFLFRRAILAAYGEAKRESRRKSGAV
jgi:glycosyltransferase involved in cell wall biosynthesis